MPRGARGWASSRARGWRTRHPVGHTLLTTVGVIAAARSWPDLGLALLATGPNAQHLVDGIEIGPGRGLDHVGGDSPTGDLHAARVELHDHVAEGIDAAG